MITASFVTKRFENTVAVLFLPRAILSAFWIMVEIDSAYAVPFSALPFFMNPAFNIAATPIHSIVYTADFANVPAMLYALLYACGLLVVGGLAFHKRKSEASEHPYTSRVIQTVVAICFGLLPLSWLTVLMNVSYRYGSSSTFIVNVLKLPLAVTSILFSFIFYCLYELISSRKMKSVVRAIKFYPICLAVSAFLLFVPAWIGTYRTQPRVSSEDIRSYRINSESSLTVPYALIRDRSYTGLVLSRHTFTDETGKRLIEEFSGTETLDRDFLAYSADFVTVNVGGLFMKVVHVPDNALGESGIGRLTRICLSDQGLIEELYAFPGGHVWYECEGLTPQEAKEVGLLFAEEYETLSLEQRKMLLNGSIPGTYADKTRDSTVTMDLSITLYGCKGTLNYEADYVINDLTPKTADKYLSILNARNGDNSHQALMQYVKWMETPAEVNEPRGLKIGRFSVDTWSAWNHNDREQFATPMEASPALYRMLKALSEAPLSTDSADCITAAAESFEGRYHDYTAAAGFEIPEAYREEILRWMHTGSWKS